MQRPKLITALITPFKNEGIDIEGLQANIDHQIEAGVDAILLLGTTGESPTVTSEERRLIITTSLERSAGRIQIWVGTGTNSTQSTIELTREAQSLGADAALIVTPYYNCPTQEGIYAHFAAICAETDMPICLYNIPKRTGRNISVETMKKISTLPNIFGNKESTGDLGQAADILEQVPLTVWSGDDALVLPMMALGGIGVISVASNLVPKQIKEVVDAASQGDFQTARTHFYPLLPLLRALFAETNPVPVKAAMNFCGMAAGPCRLPLTELSANNRQMLQQILQQTLSPVGAEK